jgi:hypothetical protein
MDITQCDLEIKRHAFIRAMERGVSPDMIEATLKGGRIEVFAKHTMSGLLKNIKDSQLSALAK